MGGSELKVVLFLVMVVLSLVVSFTIGGYVW